MKSITITKASLNDLNYILEIENSQTTQILNENIIINDFKNNNNIYLLAKKNNLAIGYLAFSHIIDTADITSLMVKEAFQNQGVATALLNELIIICKSLKISSIFLEVRESNTRAINLYKKLNFEIISKRNNYYSNNETALIFKKNI